MKRRKAEGGFYIGFFKGSPLPGTLSSGNASSAWAKTKAKNQSVQDARDLGFEVRKCLISWVE